MPMLVDQIRPIVLAIISHNGKILVSPGFDQVKKTNFYRLLGGGIDFGEDSLTALQREIQEELGVEIKKAILLGVKENIFQYNGNSGHEICFVYQCTLDSEEIYQKDKIQVIDKPGHFAIWLEINEQNISKIYPDGFAKYFETR
jgi:8-oxo-dGTP pyrophosphatase MutT (NUDIX family)